MEIVEIIKSMLAPAVMINCCGLFLLGMNNRYSVVVGRIRAMEDEKRKLYLKKKNDNIIDFELNRYVCIQNQLKKLFFRVKLIRNAVIFYNISVAFFVITCLLLGLKSVYTIDFLPVSVSLITFFTGLILVLTAVFFATQEIIKGYEIVEIEVNDSVINDVLLK